MSVIQQFLSDFLQLFTFLLSVAFVGFHLFLSLVQSPLQSAAPVDSRHITSQTTTHCPLERKQFLAIIWYSCPTLLFTLLQKVSLTFPHFTSAPATGCSDLDVAVVSITVIYTTVWWGMGWTSILQGLGLLSLQLGLSYNNNKWRRWMRTAAAFTSKSAGLVSVDGHQAFSL